MVALIEDRRPGLRTFVAWWLEELRGFLPRRRRRRAAAGRVAVLLVDHDEVTAALVARGSVQELGRFRLGTGAGSAAAQPEAEATLAELRRLKAPVVLRLAPRYGLVRGDTLPATAEPHLREIVAHKLDLLTPWSAEQALFDPEIVDHRADGQLEVRVTAVPSAPVTRIMERLTALGLTVASVDLAGAERWAPPRLNLLGGPVPGTRKLPVGWALLAVLLVVAAMGLSWSWSEIHARRLVIDERRQFEQALLRRLADVPELRQRIDTMREEAGVVAKRVADQPSPLIVIEVLSRLLPDTVWLTELSLQGRELVIGGYAPDAAQLVPLLEASPHFADVRFRAPSVKAKIPTADGGQHEVERFMLAGVVEPVRDHQL